MDVTLCCEGEQLRAHKVILSACSLTFRNLLKKNPSQNPVILLWVGRPEPLQVINVKPNVKGQTLRFKRQARRQGSNVKPNVKVQTSRFKRKAKRQAKRQGLCLDYTALYLDYTALYL